LSREPLGQWPISPRLQVGIARCNGCTEQLLLTAAVMSLLDAIRMQAGQGKAIPKLTNILKSDMPDDVLVHVLKTLVNLSLCCM
jgi:hypothetical protein